MRELAQVVGVAQRVATRPIVAIARPAVVHARAPVAGQNADRLQCGGPPGGMARVVRQLWGARHMRPLQPRTVRPHDHDAQPRLVVVQHRRLAQRHLDLLLDPAQSLGPQPHQVDQRADRERRAEDVGHQLAHARIGDELLLDQIGRECSQPGAVLLRRADTCGRLARGRRPTGGAAHMQDLVFGDVQPHGRELLHLPPLDPAGRIAGQLLPTRAALRRSMRLDGVRRRDQRHTMAAVPGLAPTPLAALLAQTLGLASQPIAGRRLTTVVAVLRHTAFQLLHTRQ